MREVVGRLAASVPGLAEAAQPLRQPPGRAGPGQRPGPGRPVAPRLPAGAGAARRRRGRVRRLRRGVHGRAGSRRRQVPRQAAGHRHLRARTRRPAPSAELGRREPEARRRPLRAVPGRLPAAPRGLPRPGPAVGDLRPAHDAAARLDQGAGGPRRATPDPARAPGRERRPPGRAGPGEPRADPEGGRRGRARVAACTATSTTRSSASSAPCAGSGPRRTSTASPSRVEVQHLAGEPEPFADVVRRPFEPCAVGLSGGPPWSTSWFHLTGDVPAALRDRTVELHVDLGFTAATPGFQAEGLAYDADGRILKGIEPRTAYVPVSGDSRRRLRRGRGQPDRVRRGVPADPARRRADRPARPALPARPRPSWSPSTTEVRALGHDVEVLLGTVTSMLEGDPRRARVLTALAGRWPTSSTSNDIAGGAARRARAAGRRARRARQRQRPPRLGRRPRAHRLGLAVAGARDRSASARARSPTSLALAEEHDELRFACSSAQQYAWMQRAPPRAVRADPGRRRGRARSCRSAACGWSPTPTCRAARRWSASSCTAPGSSARSSASRPTRCGCPTRSATPARCRRSPGWPASGGSSARRCPGTRPTDFPHHTFWWEGIDGTRVFTHFPPTDTYNAEVTGGRAGPRGVAGSATRGRRHASLLLFGYGDGGGGPTREMVERARRFADLEGMPRVAHRVAGGVLRRGARRSTPTRRCGRARCTWSTTAASTPRRSR